MLRNAGTSIRHTHLPLELLNATCSKPSLDRFISAAAESPRRPPPSARNDRGYPRGRASGSPSPYVAKSKSIPPVIPVKGPLTASGERPKRMLEPHVLSGRLKALCDDGKLDIAVDMLKTAPLDSQSTPVWNTLIWEALKAQRWNLSYKLFTDIKRRGLSPTTRTYQTMFSGLSRLEHWPTHTLQLTHAHQLYDFFLKHLQTVKYHTPGSEELTVAPLAKYIKILGDAGDFQRIFDIYYAMDLEGPLAPSQEIFTAMFQVMANRRLADGDEGAIFHNQNGSTTKLVWTQMEKASKKSPGFEIDSHIIAMAIKALARGRPTDQEFALDIVRDHLGLVRPGETTTSPAAANLTVHTLAAALESCNEMQKPRVCIHYLSQVMHPRYSTPRGVRAKAHVVDRGHVEQGLLAYLTLAKAKVPGQSTQALDTLQWMLKSEITQSNIKLRPRSSTYNLVLKACHNAGDWAGAMRTFEMMTGYDAGDFADLEQGSVRSKPVMTIRSKGRNISPDAEVMSSMVRTATMTQLPAHIRQSLRMVDHINIHSLFAHNKVNGAKDGLITKKEFKLEAFYQKKLALALVEGIDTLKRAEAGRQLIEDSRWSQWGHLQNAARGYLTQDDKGREKRGKIANPSSSGKQAASARKMNTLFLGQTPPAFEESTPSGDADLDFIFEEQPRKRPEIRS